MRPEDLVARFDEPVRRWFARRVTNATDAEDLAQDTMVAALESLGRFRGDSSLDTWIYAIARNVFLKYLRGTKRQPLSLALGSEPADTSAAGPEDAIAVTLAISHLPMHLREVFTLYYVRGMSTAEVASQLERSQGTVKFHLYEIRRRVRSMME